LKAQKSQSELRYWRKCWIIKKIQSASNKAITNIERGKLKRFICLCKYFELVFFGDMHIVLIALLARLYTHPNFQQGTKQFTQSLFATYYWVSVELCLKTGSRHVRNCALLEFSKLVAATAFRRNPYTSARTQNKSIFTR